MKERVANAFAYDPAYALAWVEIPDGTCYEDLADECKYGMLESECNSAFRDCIKSIALKNKVQTETERMHTISRRLGSRQILWLLYDFLRPHVTGDSTFKLVDLVKTTIDRFTHGTEPRGLHESMGSCACGHLRRSPRGLDPAEARTSPLLRPLSLPRLQGGLTVRRLPLRIFDRGGPRPSGFDSASF